MIKLGRVDVETASAEQRDALAEILEARGRTLGDSPGPFGPLLHSPGGARAVGALGAFCRYRTSLDRGVIEAVTLASAYTCGSAYEVAQHEPLARAAGLDDAQLEAIRGGAQGSPVLSPEMSAAVDVAAHVARGSDVPIELGDRARSLLGERGVTEVVIVAGYYLMLSRLIATFMNPR